MFSNFQIHEISNYLLYCVQRMCSVHFSSLKYYWDLFCAQPMGNFVNGAVDPPSTYSRTAVLQPFSPLSSTPIFAPLPDHSHCHTSLLLSLTSLKSPNPNPNPNPLLTPRPPPTSCSSPCLVQVFSLGGGPREQE